MEKILDPEKIRKKLKLASDLFDFALKVKTYQLTQKHPELNDHEIKKKAYELIERGCS